MEISKEMVEIRAADGAMPAFLAQPRGDGAYPGVVVVQEAFGLNDHIKDVAARLASEGYAALAPDLYYRQSRRAVGYDELPEAIRLMSTLTDEKVVADMAAVISHLQALPQVRADRIGVTGFCMGGYVTFITACRNPAVKAAVPFYGGGIGSDAVSERRPKPALQYADQISAPMLLFFGGQDRFIPAEEVEKIERRLAELHKDAETVVYPEAPHGFFCAERDSYRQQAAADAWERMKRFLARHLKG